MAFFSELTRRSPHELMHSFTVSGRAKEVPEEDRELWLGEVAFRIAKTGSEGIDFLLACMPNVDEIRLRAILVALSLVAKKISSRRRAELCFLTRNLLNDHRPMVLAEVVDTLSHLGCQEAKPDVILLLNHPSPYVVGSVLRFMAGNFSQEAVPLLEQALDSEEPIIRQNAIDELDDLNYVPALPRIRQRLGDTDQDVRKAALAAVQNLEQIEQNQ